MHYAMRVQLKNASFVDLARLWSETARRGFTDVVVADDGRRFKLMPGDYDIVTDQDLFTVYRLAKDAANATGRESAIDVQQTPARMWDGLAQV